MLRYLLTESLKRHTIVNSIKGTAYKCVRFDNEINFQTALNDMRVKASDFDSFIVCYNA